jgi:hypothetical protein
MDRGIPTEETLAEMRQSDPPIGYLVGTPKGRLSKLEKSLVGLPWREVRPGVEVKLLAEDDDLYVFAQSRARIDKERAMRKRQLKQLWARLAKLAHMDLTRESLLMKLGAARAKAPAAWRLLDITVDPDTAAFTYALNRNKLRQARRREGRYLLRTNLRGRDPAELWRFYIQLVEVEAAFKTLKDDLNLRPIYHQLEQRIEAHIFRGLPRLLPARHAARQAPADGSRPHPARRARQARRHPDARRPLPHHRRPNADPEPHHRAGRRPETPSPAPRPHPAAPPPAANRRPRSGGAAPTIRHVVETCDRPALIPLPFLPAGISS